MKIHLFFIFIAAIIFSQIDVQAQTKAIAPQKSSKPKPSNQSALIKPTPVPSSVKQNQSETRVSSPMEIAILDELNMARKEPEKYIQYLEEYKKLFKGKTAYFPNFLRVETQEGTIPVDEAIEFMKSLPKLDAYRFSNGLNKAAAMQLGDLIENSSLGHTGKDGSNLLARLAKFGAFGGRYAENIAFYSDVARNVVLTMIVDDNVASRSHRKNVFSTDLKVLGIAYGKGKSGEGICVIDFAVSFIDAGKPGGVREM